MSIDYFPACKTCFEVDKNFFSFVEQWAFFSSLFFFSDVVLTFLSKAFISDLHEKVLDLFFAIFEPLQGEFASIYAKLPNT